MPDTANSKHILTRCRRSPLSFALCWSLAIGPAATSAAAADFNNAQHVFVPATVFERRIDFTENRPASAIDLDHPPQNGSNRTVVVAGDGGAATIKPKPKSKHPYGQIPPPPAVSGASAVLAAPSVVPPPPPYTSSNPGLAAAAKDLHERVQKTANNPQVQGAIKELRKEAEDYARSGKMAQAKHAVAEALQLTPHDKTLIRELGKISVERAHQLMQTADIDGAVKYARQALAFDAGNGDARGVLDNLLQKQGVNPSDASSRLKIADLLASQGHNDDAWVEYQAANRLRPSAEAHVGMGNVALRAGQKDRAKSEYQAAEEVNPSSPLGHRQLGIMKLKQGDIVGANTELSRALILDPHDQYAAKELVDLWQNQVSRVPGANSHLGLARAYQLAGDLQSAQAQYRDVVAIDPNNPHLAAARESFKLALAKQEAEHDIQAAQTLESQGAIEEACQKLTDAVQLSPGDSDLRVHQGYLLEQLHRYSAAHDAYMDALKINPHNLLAASRLKGLPGQAVFVPQSPGAPVPSAAGSALVDAHSQNVNSLSNFAYALRNHMVVQKNNISAVEDQAHDMIASIGQTGAQQSLVTSGLGGAGGLSGAGSVGNAGTGADGLSGSVSDTLAKARAAVAQANGGKAPSPLSPAFTHSGSMPPVAPDRGLPAASLPGSAPVPSGMPGLAPPIGTGGAAANSDTAYLDRVLSSTKTPAADDSAALALPTPLLPPIKTNNSDTLPPLAPPIQLSRAGSPSGSTFPQPGGSGASPLAVSLVKFELLNASPKLKAVQLNVVLRNDGDVPLLISRNTHGVIRYTNRNDAEVKVVFNTSAIPPHSSAQGTINVPYDQADPTADLFLPGFLPPGATDRDVHLTANLAALGPPR
ncbi:MAG TPA: tetratricopeptide repeat protein [Candidatus Obscuribacterales bacterium]